MKHRHASFLKMLDPKKKISCASGPGRFFLVFILSLHRAGDAAAARTERTHPHCWRDAPGAGLAVARPEGAIVPTDGRVELQLMPFLLQGRKEGGGGGGSVSLFAVARFISLQALHFFVLFLLCAVQMAEMKAQCTLREE